MRGSDLAHSSPCRLLRLGQWGRAWTRLVCCHGGPVVHTTIFSLANYLWDPPHLPFLNQRLSQLCLCWVL
jgi:hypothetical protein